MTTIRDRIVEFKRVPASSLVPNPKNFRTHNDQQRDMLRKALDGIGFAGAELVRVLPDGRLMLIDGHLRQEEMIGQDIPVLITDLNAQEADALLATFDPIGRLAGVDDEKAQALIDELVGTEHDYAAELLSAIAKNDNLDAILASLADQTLSEHTRTTTPNEPKGGDLEKQLGVFVPCKDEREQQRVYRMLQEMGVDQCKIVSL